MTNIGLPPKQGLYDPAHEHDACGMGFVVDLKNRKSHDIIEQALQILVNLEHRGACGCEKNTGDGAGILIQMPHDFLKRETAKIGVDLPVSGRYGVGNVFLPKEEAARKRCEKIFEDVVREEGQEVLGWRDIPTDNSSIGPTALAAEPFMRQVFIKKGKVQETADGLAFERKLCIIRKLGIRKVRKSGVKLAEGFYIASLSYRTLVYKGMLNSSQLRGYYPDLADPEMTSALGMVHSRFSTNTFPSWNRAHPYRYLCHNGEINTLRGNINWMHAREDRLQSALFGNEELQKMRPVIDVNNSDSGMFDNVLELLTLTGRSIAHAMMMMIPEPWSGHESMSEEKKAFYEYHSCMMEPWDGPAAVAFTDGVQIGATLDRNGLRPARYYVTKDDRLIMSSEVGVLEIAPENIAYKGRLQPGRMLLADLNKGRIIDDEELKHELASEYPYDEWLKQNMVKIEDLPDSPHVHETDHQTVLVRQQAFGYTSEELQMLLTPMAGGAEAIGSMGTDTPLAVLSNKSLPLYSYFKQLFAQVTNPPIDAIREELVTSSETTIGPEANMLEPTPEVARQIALKTPIFTNENLEKVRHLRDDQALGFKSITLPILFDVDRGGNGLEEAMTKLCGHASQAIKDGSDIIILSDRGIDRQHAAIPALLAVAGVHHHLIREGTRTQCGLVLESGEPREVHHFALLLGYGAAAINPYLAFETLHDMINTGLLKGVDHDKAVYNYIKAVTKGVVKILSKMGISTVQSYTGAQIFEAIGLNQDVIDKYFTWTPSRIAGIGLEQIAREIWLRHNHAFPDRQVNGQTLDVGGQYKWRKEGEAHLFNPETIHLLQKSTRLNDYGLFKQYSQLIDKQAEQLYTLRGLMEFKSPHPPVPLDEVESVETIVKRFKTGAMSYGSISKEAHEALAIAMNRLGGKSNTGEGGEDPERYHPLENGDSKNSAIKQVASGRFGVTSEYLVSAKELQIKMAQGAKPGEGGQLPGSKVYPWIAKTRHSTPGVGLISPPPHHDIYSIEDLAQLIYDLKNANRAARISVKLVAEVGVGTIAAGVAKAHADVVLISGHDGGTGASPQTSIKHAGAPWELGLAETHQVLVLNNLRSRIAVETDGQLKTGRDVIVAALLGAEEFGFATAPLVILGCIVMRVCHLNTCPVGVATQDPELRKQFMGSPDHVVNFMRFIAEEVRELMGQLGFRTINEMIGHTEILEKRRAIEHWKAQGLDFSSIFYQPEVGADVGRYCQISQDHELEKTLDLQVLLDLCQPAIEEGKVVRAELPIKNINRTVGTITGSELTKKRGARGLPDDTIKIKFNGSAGQSFGAFLPPGMTLELEGDSNDYCGKGLSGGKIIIYPPKASTFDPAENILIGNVALYGATGGEAYFNGVAGERFGVRNSGVLTVVEGVGDHGCEYMTGGRVVVLGKTGRNFAAGMSGGIAYLFDREGDFAQRCNKEMVGLTALRDFAGEAELVKELIHRHASLTGSPRAAELLLDWEDTLSKFVRIIPHDYARVLEAQTQMREQGLPEEEAVMAAFEMNANNGARAGGK